MHVGRPMAVVFIVVGQLRDGTGTNVVAWGIHRIGGGRLRRKCVGGIGRSCGCSRS